MNDKAKTQREIVDKLRIKMIFRREELLAAEKLSGEISSKEEILSN